MPHKRQIRYALFMAKMLWLKRTVRKWFARFKAGNFDHEDQEGPGRPPTTDEDMIRTEIENSPRSTLRQLTGMLNKSKSTIHDHIVKFGYCNEKTPFLKQLRTKDEKLIIYKNVQRKRSGESLMKHL
ncbi:histone-lysine N-methyltransferase SETMAR-like [Lasioglossum baleicum]|uniref:histone-lysine N-methyltransferase SETMAR-like n=1 Tax=Lasioglossum baleicum TaxID=434251 RepID=UPI003FCCBF71